jgi:tRNA pseudouridine38-40 synthase
MRTIKLTLSYDGTDYAGWQIQPRQRTVQQTLEEVVEKITGFRSSILASGRTDAGVHALGQVASFRSATQLSVDVLQRAINAQLPQDIAVHCAEDVPDGFNPIRHAVRKRYRYLVFDGPVRDVFQLRYTWHWVYGRLNVEAMQRAAASLVGTHDFSSYETSGAPRKSSIRTIHAIDIERGRGERAGMVILEVEANGFLYNMVRNIVGTLVEVGRGAESEGWPQEVLVARDRCRAGRTAPPQGLFLLWVEYGPIAVAQRDDSSQLEDVPQAEG